MMDFVSPVFIGGAVAIGLFLGILLALRGGRRIGLRAVARYGEAGVPAIGSMETAVFGLLGLMIAFTFSGALTRFDSRRVQAVEEVNAIGTAYLRIDLLPAETQPRMRDLMRRYADSRIATYRRLPNMAAARGEVANSQNLQGEMWTHAVQNLKLAEGRASAEVLLLPALNQMFDLQAARIAATQIHPPLIIYAMLLGLAIAASFLAGYQTANQRGYTWMHKIGFAGIVAFTVFVILDLEYPRLGFVRIDAIDELMVSARESMR